MIREAILFADSFGSNSQQTMAWKDKKFVIINTKEINGTLEYDKLEIIDDTSSMCKWIENNKHYKKILENLNDYILPSYLNKSMGSTGGLATSSFFIFKLSDKNLDKMPEKIKKTKFSDDKNDMVSIENIHKILMDATTDLTKKVNGEFQYLKHIAIIHTTETRFKNWKTCADNFIKEKSASLTSGKKPKGQCSVCKKIDDLRIPLFLTNYDSGKIFLIHTTKNSMDGKGTPFLACADCVLKLIKFKKILKDYKIKILPLFINPNAIRYEIKLIKYDLDKDKNPFDFIFDQIKDKKNTFDFYLFIKRNDYFFYDYITNYKWEIGNYIDFFSKDKYPITRHGLEEKISSILVDKNRIEYFDKIKGKDNLQTFMIYSMRQKIFDFVYRNKNTLTVQNIQDIVLFRIETEIRNSSVNVEKKCRESLNLSFNNCLWLNLEMDEDKILLNRVNGAINSIDSEDQKFEICDDEEWAYFAGQLAYYLVSLSKSNNKNYALLEPFINKTTTKLVKITIQQLFERYKHEIGLNNKRFRILTTQVLSYDIDISFITLKIPFYVGVFDVNIMYQKKENVMNK